MIRYYVRVRTREQLDAVLRWGKAEVLMPDGALAGDLSHVFCAVKDACEASQIVVCLPDVLRQSRLSLLENSIPDALEIPSSQTGLLIRNLDELGMIRERRLREQFRGMLIADPFLYAYNSEAMKFYLELFPDLCFIGSDELTDREMQQARQNSPLPADRMILKVYGHQPLMISNQCLNRNYTNCAEHLTSFQDRHRERFYAASNCPQCYSTIYNGTVTWLLDKVNERGYAGSCDLLLDFTVEELPAAEHVLSCADQAASGAAGQIPMPDLLTRGHHVKGVE